MYEGEWVDGAPKCGTYHDDTEFNAVDDELDDGEGHSAFQLPEVGIACWITPGGSLLIASVLLLHVAGAGLPRPGLE
jgi:hypothetical protein